MPLSGSLFSWWLVLYQGMRCSELKNSYAGLATREDKRTAWQSCFRELERSAVQYLTSFLQVSSAASWPRTDYISDNRPVHASLHVSAFEMIAPPAETGTVALRSNFQNTTHECPTITRAGDAQAIWDFHQT